MLQRTVPVQVPQTTAAATPPVQRRLSPSVGPSAVAASVVGIAGLRSPSAEVPTLADELDTRRLVLQTAMGAEVARAH